MFRLTPACMVCYLIDSGHRSVDIALPGDRDVVHLGHGLRISIVNCQHLLHVRPPNAPGRNVTEEKFAAQRPNPVPTVNKTVRDCDDAGVPRMAVRDDWIS